MSKEIEKNENKKAPNHGELGHAYELAFHLVPTLGDDRVNKVFEEVINLVEKNKGKVVSQSEPALLDLEYQMEKTVDSIKMKFNQAYFAWVIFEGGDVIALKESLDAHKNILRFLLIKTEQKDSIPAVEVAQILNGNHKEEKGYDEVQVEEVADSVEEEIVEEETPASVEDSGVAKEDAKTVDDAIDELVK